MVYQLDIIIQFITSYLEQFGVLFGMLLIMLESILPVLPLGVFIAFNMMAFGSVVGFLMSWLSTCVGCLLSYLFFYKLFNKLILQKASKVEKLNKIVKKIKNMDFSKLVLIIALPFTPAFLINIACGLVKVNLKKFMTAILIGKISIVFFWGFICKSLLQSITDIKTIIILLILLLVCYILSKVASKKMKIE